MKYLIYFSIFTFSSVALGEGEDEIFRSLFEACQHGGMKACSVKLKNDSDERTTLLLISETVYINNKYEKLITEKYGEESLQKLKGFASLDPALPSYEGANYSWIGKRELRADFDDGESYLFVKHKGEWLLDLSKSKLNIELSDIPGGHDGEGLDFMRLYIGLHKSINERVIRYSASLLSLAQQRRLAFTAFFAAENESEQDLAPYADAAGIAGLSLEQLKNRYIASAGI